MGLPPSHLAIDRHGVTYLGAETLIRISRFNSGEPYFDMTGGNRFDAPRCLEEPLFSSTAPIPRSPWPRPHSFWRHQALHRLPGRSESSASEIQVQARRLFHPKSRHVHHIDSHHISAIKLRYVNLQNEITTAFVLRPEINQGVPSALHPDANRCIHDSGGSATSVSPYSSM